MTFVTLNSKAIGAIRRLVRTYCSRDELKQYLLEAGANSDRVLGIHVSGDMKSKEYKAMSTVINEGFDTISEDFDKSEADGIMLELVRVVFSYKQVSEDDRVNLENALAGSSVALSPLLEQNSNRDILKYAIDSSKSANLKEAHENLKKALSRILTDPSGAITVSVSAAESVCLVALSRLGIPVPSSKTLPKYLVEIRKKTNLNELARIQDSDDRIITALSNLAENTYHASHKTGDRHAQGDSGAALSPIIVDTLVLSACSITVILAGALHRNELKKLESMNENQETTR